MPFLKSLSLRSLSLSTRRIHQAADLALGLRERLDEIFTAEPNPPWARPWVGPAWLELLPDERADVLAQWIACAWLAAPFNRPAAEWVQTSRAVLPFSLQQKLGFSLLDEILLPEQLSLGLDDGLPGYDRLFEHFLSIYDPQRRVRRGVFFTPPEAAAFLVRGVGALLQTYLGCSWKDAGAARLQVIDPAAGTGCFGVELARQAREALLAGERPSFELGGYEFLAAPWLLAQWSIQQAFEGAGMPFEPDKNWLKRTSALDAPPEPFAGVRVVLGNPPYSAHSAIPSPALEGLLREYYEMDGQPLAERNLKWLRDDYVKFVRWGEAQIEAAQAGVLAFILPHGLADNPTFRAARAHLRRTFQQLFFLDLHGNLNRTAQAGCDENIFPIRQGVGMLFALRLPAGQRDGPGQVWGAEIRGPRSEKLDALKKKGFEEVDWQKIEAGARDGVLTQNGAFLCRPVLPVTDYERGWPLPQILGVNSPGIVTSRDRLVFAFTREELEERVRRVLDPSVPDEELEGEFFAGPRRGQRPSGGSQPGGWSLAQARQALMAGGAPADLIVCLYRPFDRRWLWYQPQVIERMRWRGMQPMLLGPNLGLVVSRFTRGEPFRDALVTRLPVEFGVVACRVSNNAPLFPLYIYTNDKNEPCTRRANLSAEWIRQIKNDLHLTWCEDGRGATPDEFGPEDVLHYLYALLNAPAFRAAYAGLLGLDFPRLPLPGSRELFWQLARLGADLTALHLLEEDYPAASWAGAPEASPWRCLPRFAPGLTPALVEHARPEALYRSGRVVLNPRLGSGSPAFEGISPQAWQFCIGNYAVLPHWLDERAARAGRPAHLLSAGEIEHFCRTAAALTASVECMRRLDDVLRGRAL